MIRKAKAGLAVLSLASAMAFGGSALAQDMGFYAGAALGKTSVDLDCTGASTCDDSDTSWRVFGGYQFNRNFALELGYINLGEARVAGTVPPFGTVSATFESTAFDLVAVGSMPIADRFSIYGKIGLYRADTDVDVAVGAGAGTESDTNADITFGIGVRYDFTRNLGVRAEWQRYSDVTAGEFGESDLDVISVGVLFRF